MNKRTLFILIFIICLIVFCTFCLTIGLGSYSIANGQEALPTTAPVESCSNGGLTVLDGCRWIYLPIVGR